MTGLRMEISKISAEDLVLPADSIYGVLLKRAQEQGSKIAVEFGDRELSYAETARLSRRFASSLAKLGVGKGDKVGIMLPNLPEFLFAYYGALMAGGTVVLYNVLLRPPEIQYECAHSETKVMVTSDQLYPAVAEGTRNAPTLEHVVVLGDAPAKARPFEELLHEGSEDFDPPPIELEDLAHLIYTSGTTGKPKGAMITHHNVLANLASIDLMRPREEWSRTLCVLPLFHAFGLIAVMNGTILRGGTVLLQPRFEAGPVIDALKHKRVTSFAGTPTMYFHILNHSDSEGAKFPHLRRAGSGGAPLPLEIRHAFHRRFGIDLSEGYGLSETTVSACSYPEGLPVKSGSVGIPIPGLEVKVVNEKDEEVGIGEVGEIVCRGRNVMKGYYKNPEATAEAIRGGWLHTGDLGYMDEKGYFSIVDRKKDMIIKGGYNIYPREIEEVIYQLPEINMAAVIGLPDAAKGELVHALVSLKPGQSLSPEKILEHLAANLAKYKLPSSIRVLPELPVGPTGKILKRELRRRWAEICEAE